MTATKFLFSGIANRIKADLQSKMDETLIQRMNQDLKRGAAWMRGQIRQMPIRDYDGWALIDKIENMLAFMQSNKGIAKHHLIINANFMLSCCSHLRLMLECEIDNVLLGALYICYTLDIKSIIIVGPAKFNYELLLAEQQASVLRQVIRNALSPLSGINTLIQACPQSWDVSVNSAFLAEELMGQPSIYSAHREHIKDYIKVDDLRHAYLIMHLEVVAAMFILMGLKSKGVKLSDTKLVSISGYVHRPMVIQERGPQSLRALIESCGGVQGGWENLKCVFPSGLTSPLLNKEECESLMNVDYREVKALGSYLDSAGIVVVSKKVESSEIMTQIVRVFEAYICRNCMACRGYILWIKDLCEPSSFEHNRINNLEAIKQIIEQAGKVEHCSVLAAFCRSMKKFIDTFSLDFIL